MAKKWDDQLVGVSVVCHYPIEMGADLGHYISEIISKMKNPVLAIINVKANPSKKFSHVVAKTGNVKASKEIFINNILKKYPQTERLEMYGGENVILYSSLPFDL